MAETSVGLWAYPAVFVALVAAGLGAPLPEEVPVVTAGVLCAQAASPDPVPPPYWTAALALPGVEGNPILSAAVAAKWAADDRIPKPRRHPIWWIMLPVCIVGVVTCDGMLYAMGRLGGAHLVESKWFQKYVLKPEKRATIEANFHKFGVRLLLGVRLLPGIRAPVFVMAGVVRLPLHRFLLADGIYAIPVVTVLFTLAYWFTDSVVKIVDNVERHVGSLKHYFIIIGIASFAIWMLYEFWKRWVVTGDPKEVPLIGDKMIKPPHETADDFGDEKLPITKDPPQNRSLRSLFIAGGVAVIVCWVAYESIKRWPKRN